ncbi:MAG TPA: MqnA/MqnD/SBP family protein, partial [Blastocatellia bacterium]|nr:MqnA/MqnD/SBP family protein [Blastocatellia bacterium]
YDLAEEWRKHTGLPFVFAFWAIRADSSTSFERDSTGYRTVDFLVAKLEGTAHADELADIYSRRLGLPRDELFSYLTEAISYELDEESLQGLRLYFELASEVGLIREARSLVFLD